MAVAIGRHVRAKTGDCYPGYELLAKESGVSLATIERSVAALTKFRHLRVGTGRPVILTPALWSKLPAAPRMTEAATELVAPARRDEEEPPF